MTQMSMTLVDLEQSKHENDHVSRKVLSARTQTTSFSPALLVANIADGPPSSSSSSSSSSLPTLSRGAP